MGVHVSSVIVRPWLVLLQTSIITDGFRSLAEGEQVEFYVESGDDGRTKAVQVTGPGGAPPQVFPDLTSALRPYLTPLASPVDRFMLSAL